MRRTLLLWIAFHSFWVSAQHFHDTQGKLEINHNGQATYTLPIALPPSLKGVAPTINVVYQSGTFGGIAGQGWNIQSVSAITRIASRSDLDGFRKGVHFDNTDKLALDGQRLILVSGQYWHIGSVYQTETQSNLRIELQRSGAGRYFIVTAPDGSRSWYGNYNSHGTDLSAFYISRYEDPLGNYISYHYTKPFAKSLCIGEIRFSANTSGLAPLNSIHFHYKKAVRTEMAYAKGQKLEKMALLSYIEVKTNNQLFRKYVFTHRTDEQLGYEKVAQIQEFNGAMEPANPVRFEYENTQTLGVGSELLTTYHNNLNFDSIVLSGDFDGDGRLDFTTENQIFTDNFTGINGQTPVNAPIVFDKQDTFTATTLTAGKLNPFQSIVKYSEGEGFKVYHFQNRNLTLSYTKSFNFPAHLPCFNPTQTCTSVKNAFIEGDFNGDGISEVLFYKICTVGQGRKYTQYECGQFCWVDLNPNVSGTGPAPGATILSNPGLLLGKKRYVGDFNGDGKSDILIINTNGTYKVVGLKQLNTAPWMELELLGSGTLDYFSPTKQILFGDFNGDGKTDIMLPQTEGKNPGESWWYIYYSNPKPARGSFFEAEAYNIVEYWPDSHTYFKTGRQFSSYYALDTNGDGKSDLVRIWRNHYKPKWTINNHDTNWKITSFANNIGKNGTGGFTPDYVTPCRNYDNSCDHHSDSPDIPIPVVATYRSGVNKEILMVRNHTNQVTYIHFTKDVAQDNLLKRVLSGGGNRSDQITYQTLEPDNYNNGCGTLAGFYSSANSLTYPNVEIKRLPFSRVVSRLSCTIGEITRHQDFRYHGYTVNMQGLGALGFSKTARSSWYQTPTDTKTWNVIQNDPAQRGLLLNSYTQLELHRNTFSFASGTTIPNNAINSVVNEYSVSTNNNIYIPLLTRQTTTDHLTSVKTVKDFHYLPVYYLPDVIRTQNFLGKTKQGETTSETEYQNNPSGTGSAYYIGRPVKNTITTSAYNDSHRSETLYSYNTNGTLQKRQQKPVAEAYYQTEELEYDRYGNITRKTLSTPGSKIPATPRVTEYTYDPSARFTTTSKDIMGRVSQYTYHPLYGTVLTETDPNTLTTTTAYDNWGKPTTVTDYLGKSLQYTYRKEQHTHTTQITGADGSSSLTVTNILGQPVKEGKKLSNGQWTFITTQYDFLGRKIKVSEPFYDSPSLWTTYAYDDYGRLTQTALPTGKTSRVTYNGLTVTTNDGRKTSSVTKNANGHTIHSTGNGGTIHYQYTATGNIKESNYQDTTITTAYDRWGRKSSLSDPSAGRYQYEYYPFGETRITITPKGIVKNFIDDYGRLILTEEEPESGMSYYTRYYYNTDHTLHSSVREEYLNGKVTDEMQYEYDVYKRLKKTTQITPYATFLKEFIYDAYGRVEKEKQTATVKSSGKTSSKTFRYIYRFGDHYKILDDSTGQLLWTKDQVNAKDQLLRGTFGNGLQFSNTYDRFGYIEQVYTYHPNRRTDAGRPSIRLTSQFNPKTGNLNERQNSAFNYPETFQYDSLDRLIKWDKGFRIIHNNTFDKSTEGFLARTCATLTPENGMLKVAITPSCTGIKKVLLTQARIGEKLRVRFDFNKGTTHKTRFSIWEYNPDNGQYFKSYKNYAGNGSQVFEHTVTQYPVIELHFDTLPLAESFPIVFYLDNLKVEHADPETQQYDDRGRITENSLGQYKYTDTGKAYRNTAIELSAEAYGQYQNREGIFNDSMEDQKGWNDLGIGWTIFTQPEYDDSKAKTGRYSLKIHNPTGTDLTVHSDHWIPIDNPNGAYYTFSGWIYSDGPSSQLFLFMNTEKETGYYTLVADRYTEVTHQWHYLERTVFVPAPIKKLNMRLDNNGGGTVWFDDVRIRKTSNPKTDIRQLQVDYDMFKKPVSITETGVGKVDFCYNDTHFRNAMFYGGLETIDKRPFRKDYSSDGSMEIITNQLTRATTFVFFAGGDAYTAPVVFKSNDSSGEYLYLHRDYQGTILAISNQSGNLVEKRLFDPWGKLLQVQDGQGNNLEGLTVLDRGYTGHEHIQSIGIINMNGRLYDPKLHRFLSPDNYIQDPYNTQNYNRYGYCWNNPLKFTDPSGEIVEGLGLAVLISAGIAATTYTVTALLADVPFTPEGLLVSTAIGALNGAATFGIGQATACITQLGLRITAQAVTHGVTQGVMTGIQGGNAASGFAAGALSSLAASFYGGSGYSNKAGGYISQTKGLNGMIGGGTFGMIAFATVSGGTGAALTGGNFWQGAATGLVVSGLNHAMHGGFAKKDSEVIVLNDSEAVGGSGHMAMLAGNDKKGWTYVATEGREADNGSSITGGKSILLLENKVINPQLAIKKTAFEYLSRFDQKASIKTTYNMAMKAVNAVIKGASGYYHILFHNCGHIVREGLEAIGVYGGSRFTISPNVRFIEMINSRTIYR